MPGHRIAILSVGDEPLGTDGAIHDLHDLVGSLGEGNQVGRFFGVQVDRPSPCLPMNAHVGHFGQHHRYTRRAA
jgi:hypothetical protein